MAIAEKSIVTIDSPGASSKGLSLDRFEKYLYEIHNQPEWRAQAEIEADYYDGNQLDSETLAQFRYFGLGRKDRGLVLRYLLRLTGCSRAQLTRLVAQQRQTGGLAHRLGAPARPFATRHTAVKCGAVRGLNPPSPGRLRGGTIRTPPG